MKLRTAMISVMSTAALFACTAQIEIGGAPDDGGLAMDTGVGNPVPTVDGGFPDSSGSVGSHPDASTPDADASGGDAWQPDAKPAPDGATGVCNLSAMLSAPIVPGQSIATINLNHDGPGLASLSYIDSLGCPLPIDADASGQGELYGNWGDGGVINASVNESTEDLDFLELNAGYTGLLSFSSRPGGAYGSHTYQLGIGTVNRDGAPYTIPWTALNINAVIDEFYDGFMATYDPSVPASSQDCVAAGNCLLDINDGPMTVVGFRPLPFYFMFNGNDGAGTLPDGGVETPTYVYTFFPSGDTAPNAHPISSTYSAACGAPGAVTQYLLPDTQNSTDVSRSLGVGVQRLGGGVPAPNRENVVRMVGPHGWIDSINAVGAISESSATDALGNALDPSSVVTQALDGGQEFFAAPDFDAGVSASTYSVGWGTYVVSTLPLGRSPSGAPIMQIAAALDGNLWATDGTNTIDYVQAPDIVTVDGGLIQFPMPLSDAGASAVYIASPLVLGPDGNLRFMTGNTLGRPGEMDLWSLTPSGVYATLGDVCAPAECEPSSMIVGPDGNFWMGGSANAASADGGMAPAIVRITTAGHATEFVMPPSYNAGSPSGITQLAVGPDGNLWFDTDLPQTPLARMTLSGAVNLFPGLEASTMVTGPDGNLWIATQATLADAGTQGAIDKIVLNAGCTNDGGMPPSFQATVTLEGDAGAFACGTGPSCNLTTQYCLDVTADGSVGTYSCVPIPMECVANDSCGCLVSAVGPSATGCSASGAGFIVTK